MSIQAAIASHLIHDSRVALELEEDFERREANKAGSGLRAVDRVFHLTAPRRRRCPLPYITYQFVGTGARARHMTNVSGLLWLPLQINCWAARDEQASDIAEAVRKGLDHKNHTDIGRAPNTAYVNYVGLEPAFALYDPPTDGEEDGVFHYVIEGVVWHKESLPVLAV